MGESQIMSISIHGFSLPFLIFNSGYLMNAVVQMRRYTIQILFWHQSPFPTSIAALTNGTPLTSRSMQAHLWRRLGFSKRRWQSTLKVYHSFGIPHSVYSARILRTATAWRCPFGCSTISTSRSTSIIFSIGSFLTVPRESLKVLNPKIIWAWDTLSLRAGSR